MPDAVTTILWGVLTLSILVVLHEGGHYFAARAFGVKVHEFMIGLPGPAVRVHTASGTAFGITAVPLGGYVRIAGMEPGPEDPLLAAALQASAAEGRMDSPRLAGILGVDQPRAESLLATLADWGALTPAEDDRLSYVAVTPASYDDNPIALLAAARASTYRALNTWQRLVVLSSGVLVNLAAAIAVFTFVLAVWGFYAQSLTLYQVAEDSGAYAAGLMPGDTIVSVGEEAVAEWSELTSVIAAHQVGSVLSVTYDRAGELRKTDVVLGASPDGRPVMGIVGDVTHVDLSITQALGQSFEMTGLVFQAIAKFFNPNTFAEAADGARGVVGITVEVAEAARMGPLSYAWIVALLSLSLGIMNVLPIPPLDGGRMVMEIIERAIGRPIDRRISIGVSLIGVALLFTLIGLLMYADIMRYFVAP